MICCSVTGKRREDRSLIEEIDDEAFLSCVDESGPARRKLCTLAVSNHVYEIFGMLSAF